MIADAPAKRLLLLSVSAGAGHSRAAEALRVDALARAGVTATHLDVMDFVPAAFRAMYKDFYIGLVNRYPSIWGYVYRATDEAAPGSPMQRMRRLIERLNTREMAKAIAAHGADAIICTHFLPAELLARGVRKGRVAAPVWVQVTDFDLHRMWVHRGMRGYFAPNAEVARLMESRGLDARAVHVTGIPIMPAFSARLDRGECALAAGLDPARTTVLLMGGGEGVGGLAATAERILALGGDFQLVVMAGRNVAALRELQALARRFPGRLIGQGFTDAIERWMACADFAITKAGGLTTSECLALGLPLIVNAAIPGQEESNADFLLREGVALKAGDDAPLEHCVAALLRDPALRGGMRERARALGRPHAARDVLDVVLADLATPSRR